MKHLKDIKDWEEYINQVVCGDCLEGMKLMYNNIVDCPFPPEMEYPT